MDIENKRTKLSIFFLLSLPSWWLVPASAGVEFNFTVLPNASIRYHADANQLPQSYVTRFDGISSPVYRLEIRQTSSRQGYWSLSILHTGEFGGGEYGRELIPDNRTGGIYQLSQLNIGFVNTQATYRRAVRGWPVEALFNLSIMRGFYKRKEFIIEGADLRPTLFNNTNELSAEGFGFGLAGYHEERHRRFYGRWQTSLNYYVQLADSRTDASYGEVFLIEAGLGMRLWQRLSLEVGGLRQYWFIPGPEIRVAAPGNHEAIISWSRQETWAHGAFLRLEYNFK